MGWHEWPLMLFTLLAQTAVGAFWWCCVALMLTTQPSDARKRLQTGMVVIWVLMALAFALSSAHLGSPLRAINSTFRFLHAPLSNEIVFGGLFFGCGALYWLANWKSWGNESTQKLLLAVALLASFAFIASMSAFYMMPTVPTWNTPLTPLAFVLTALMLGGGLAAFLFTRSGITQPALLRRGPLTLAVLAAAGAVLAVLLQSQSLPDIQSSVKQAAALSPHYGALMVTRFVLLGAGLWLWSRRVLVNGGTLSPSVALAVIALLAAGEFIGRGVFYALHMTVGVL